MHVCVSAMCGWLPVCNNLLSRVFFCAFGMFLRVLHFTCVFSVSGVPVGVCIGGNFSLRIKTQLVQLSQRGRSVLLCMYVL